MLPISSAELSGEVVPQDQNGPRWAQQQPEQPPAPPISPALPVGQPQQPEPLRPWGAPPSRPKKLVPLLIGAGAFAATISVILAAAGGAAKHSEGATIPDPSPSSTAYYEEPYSSPTAEAAPVEATADVLQQIVAWRQDGGMTRLTAIVNDLTEMSAAATAGDFNALSDACNSLGSHVAAAQAYRPIPDDEAQRHWGAALSEWGSAAPDCSSGADSYDTAMIAQATQKMTSATAELRSSTARLRELSAGL